MAVSLDLASISARLAARGIDHDLDPGHEVLASVWRFAGGDAHVLVYADRSEAGTVLRFHALAADPYDAKVRKLAAAALAARADEMYGVGSVALSRAMDSDGTPTWAWAAPYPAGITLEDAFFDGLLDAFVDLLKEEVNALRFTVDGGWELMDSGLTTARYVHDRTGAVLELRLTAEAHEDLPRRIVSRDQITSRAGVEVVLDTARP
jgi:hypothetical protein